MNLPIADCRSAVSARIISRFPALPSARPTGRTTKDEPDDLMRTYSPKASEITHEWHVIDAEGMVLGRVCTEAARLLRGKHKTIFAPHIDTGDHVIIVNADKVVLTSGKGDSRMVYSYSGYPGGLKSETFNNLLQRKPDDAIRHSIKGMLPKGPLGRQMIKKLKVYAGASHPHTAQQPKPYEIAHAKAR